MGCESISEHCGHSFTARGNLKYSYMHATKYSKVPLPVIQIFLIHLQINSCYCSFSIGLSNACIDFNLLSHVKKSMPDNEVTIFSIKGYFTFIWTRVNCWVPEARSENFQGKSGPKCFPRKKRKENVQAAVFNGSPREQNGHCRRAFPVSLMCSVFLWCSKKLATKTNCQDIYIKNSSKYFFHFYPEFWQAQFFFFI